MVSQTDQIEILSAGDCAVLIRFGHSINLETHQLIQHFLDHLRDQKFRWLVEAVPAYTTLSISYDPYLVHTLDRAHSPYHYVKTSLESLLRSIDWDHEFTSRTQRIVSIPVCYGGEFGPDLEQVARFHNLTIQDVISLHTEPEYVVYMIGFMPGFPYLGGLSPKLITPRKSTPLSRVPKGAVGLAGNQTGIYPFESPGGWQILGRTPIELFQPTNPSPSLLTPGDRIRFIPISEKDFRAYREE